MLWRLKLEKAYVFHIISFAVRNQIVLLRTYFTMNAVNEIHTRKAKLKIERTELSFAE